MINFDNVNRKTILFYPILPNGNQQLVIQEKFNLYKIVFYV